ncbi:MAG TPA: hypothetical protein PK349_11925 [Candidatus Hydrogenedentes bacterium]|nr:hypothetical protein [Candidatus Hydrogenedentota bacterium]
MNVLRQWTGLLLLLPSLAAWSGSEEDLWKKAVAEADVGQYDQAISDFTRLADEGIQIPELYQNLAACYQRSGQVGRASACLEFVLRQHPAEQETLLAMLDGLTRTLDRQLPRPTTGGWREALFFWIDRIAPWPLLAGFLALWCAGWALLAARAWLSRGGIMVAGVGLLLLAGYVGMAWWHKTHPLPIGVAVQAEAPVFFGKNADDVPRFTLLEGDRVAITAMAGPWLKIRTADGKTGWARSASLAVVADHLLFPRNEEAIHTEPGV